VVVLGYEKDGRLKMFDIFNEIGSSIHREPRKKITVFKKEFL
jgi:hypothetical protein